MTMAAAMLLAVPVGANAQLKGLIKNAAGKVQNAAGIQTDSKKTMWQLDPKYSGDGSYEPSAEEQKAYAAEKARVKQAGGWQKYLELDQTENGRIVYKYWQLRESTFWRDTEEEFPNYLSQNGYDELCVRAAGNAATQLVLALRYAKGYHGYDTDAFNRVSDAFKIFNQIVPEEIGHTKKARSGLKPLPLDEIDALNEELARIKKYYETATGHHEKTAEERKAEADEGYVTTVIYGNYLLDDLTDKCRDAKRVNADKEKVNAKVKAELGATKILGTYSTTALLMGLPLQNFPDLKEKYRTVQEMRYKTFYEKDGKSYVVESAFRFVIPIDDDIHGANPDESYFPGLKIPVEIPADKIQGKF